MFTNISWSSYLTVLGVVVLIWYFIILLKFYWKDLLSFFSGEKKLKFASLKGITKKNGQDAEEHKSLSSSFSESFDTLEDAEELSVRILQTLEESNEKDFSKEHFQNYLRMVLEEYPYVKISSLRQNINKLMVTESSKYPNLLLTLSEADSLWEGTVF
ncbi:MULTISPECIES: hypothetical protein [Flavobacterium]|uniref:Uncharacterized protein n=1 Tax=Flavobacterium cutihirudinis TaxID=1265740 RepID=A0A3D9G350_9FLAO|nr:MULTISPECIES: hypothetical protein [Flavobacterium]MBZ4040957.1 hypothetical protein [Flavobacterium hibisci]RED27022.1 hypothetical protein BD847_0953 [Flavobacterium cutihirudinis]